MAETTILPIGNGGEWGPRAIELLKAVESRGQDGPLRETQKSNPEEHQKILNPGAPQAERHASLAPRDQVAFSPEALALLGG